jgi:hypothetical protein
MKKPPDEKEAEMSLDLKILDAVTPEGRGVRLSVTATDIDGTATDTTTVPVAGSSPVGPATM